MDVEEKYKTFKWTKSDAEDTNIHHDCFIFRLGRNSIAYNLTSLT